LKTNYVSIYDSVAVELFSFRSPNGFFSDFLLLDPCGGGSDFARQKLNDRYVPQPPLQKQEAKRLKF
jgi:hypothetical protein